MLAKSAKLLFNLTMVQPALLSPSLTNLQVISAFYSLSAVECTYYFPDCVIIYYQIADATNILTWALQIKHKTYAAEWDKGELDFIIL